MAKINVSKLVDKKSLADEIVIINDEQVQVKAYLPMADKSELIGFVLSNSFDNTGFASPLRQKIYIGLGIIKFYTNITITDAQMEQADKTYDLLTINNILDEVMNTIPQDELTNLYDLVDKCINQVVLYNTSFLGTFRSISEDYQSSKIDVDGMLKDLSNPEALGLVKDVITKLG